MIKADLIPTYLFLAVGILILGGIFLIYSSLEVKDSMKLFKEVNKEYLRKVTHLYENIKGMSARIDSSERYILDQFNEECERISKKHAFSLNKRIENIDNLEKIYFNQVDTVRRNTQKIDDLYQKVYRIKYPAAKRSAQKAIANKYLMRRYGRSGRRLRS